MQLHWPACPKASRLLRVFSLLSVLVSGSVMMDHLAFSTFSDLSRAELHHFVFCIFSEVLHSDRRCALRVQKARVAALAVVILSLRSLRRV